MSYTSEISADGRLLIDDFDIMTFPAPFADASLPINRNFRISALVPVDDGITKAPMVLWSHGGAKGATAAELKKTNWGRHFVDAGYIVIMISHTHPETEAEIAAVRTHLGIPAEQSEQPAEQHNLMNFLRLLDIKQVLKQIDKVNKHLADRQDITIDMTKPYALAGHSAGAGAALTFAGATRYWNGCTGKASTYNLADDQLPEPGLFLCYSLQPPLPQDHLCESSYLSVRTNAPVLTVTGLGDKTLDVSNPISRKTAHEAMAQASGGEKYLMWIGDEEPDHNFYNHTGATIRDFEEFADNMRSISIAFLDKYILQSSDADEYLRHGGMKADMAPDVEWIFS